MRNGGTLYNFVAGDRFVNPGTNPACAAGGFSVWTGLQGTKDVGIAITTSVADMVALDGRNTQADLIVEAARVVLWVIFEPLTMQR